MDRVAARTQEGRDALRAPETHPPARPATTPRPQRRPRRVPPRSRSPKPPQNSKDHPYAAVSNGLKDGDRSRIGQRHRPLLTEADFINSIGQVEPLAAGRPLARLICRSRCRVSLSAHVGYPWEVEPAPKVARMKDATRRKARSPFSIGATALATEDTMPPQAPIPGSRRRQGAFLRTQWWCAWNQKKYGPR